MKRRTGQPWPGRFGEHVAREAAVLRDVELEPDRLLRLRRDLVERAAADRGQGELHARRLRRARRLHLAAPRIHAGEADRAERERQSQLLPEDLGGEVEVGDVAKHPLAERHLGEVGDVPPQRHLRIGAAVDIVEQEAGQPPPGGLAEIGDGGDAHARTIGPAGAGAIFPERPSVDRGRLHPRHEQVDDEQGHADRREPAMTNIGM